MTNTFTARLDLSTIKAMRRLIPSKGIMYAWLIADGQTRIRLEVVTSGQQLRASISYPAGGVTGTAMSVTGADLADALLMAADDVGTVTGVDAGEAPEWALADKAPEARTYGGSLSRRELLEAIRVVSTSVLSVKSATRPALTYVHLVMAGGDNEPGSVRMESTDGIRLHRAYLSGMVPEMLIRSDTLAVLGKILAQDTSGRVEVSADGCTLTGNESTVSFAPCSEKYVNTDQIWPATFADHFTLGQTPRALLIALLREAAKERAGYEGPAVGLEVSQTSVTLVRTGGKRYAITQHCGTGLTTPDPVVLCFNPKYLADALALGTAADPTRVSFHARTNGDGRRAQYWGPIEIHSGGMTNALVMELQHDIGELPRYLRAPETTANAVASGVD